MVKTRNSIGSNEDSPDTFLSLDRRSRKSLRSIHYVDQSDDDSDEVQITDHRRRMKATSPVLGRRRSYKDEEESADDFLDDVDTVNYTREGRQSWRFGRNNNAGNGNVRRSSRQKKLVYGTFDQKVLDKALYMNDIDEEPSRKRRRNEVELVDVEKSEDMYSRVKRPRKVIKRDMYGIPIQDQESSDDNKNENAEEEEDSSSDEDDDEDDDGDEDDDDEKDKKPQKRIYYLREHKPRTKLFEVPIVERRKRVQKMFPDTPSSPQKRPGRSNVYRSPARRKVDARRRAAFHGSDTTSSSSASGESSDEERFQRRKTKSMARSRNRCLPMNISADEMKKSGVMKDRAKIGSSLADVDPMNIDRSINFDSVGGLGKHVMALKEMIVFPLLYPEVFERFKLAPPRGVLFYGPPGTGKTLVARALANECSHGDRRVSFFMRKGADCLSKWVGESERQLRLLFDQAYLMRPSIVFFDEIDGLAPVRSSRQDQIHSSIVSTLLALMDGLDSRGEIVVIGATNRIDSIDPALRRPGRFDREFLFPLPSQEARRQILHIQTKEWNPRLCDVFINELAHKTVGYCGADIKALCTEASLLALRRRYPQIYTTSEKLQLDVSSICLAAKDFFRAMQTIIPASQRSVFSPARALSIKIQPLLRGVFKLCIETLEKVFPAVLTQLSSLDAPATTSQQQMKNQLMNQFDSDDDENAPSIFEHKGRSRKKHCDNDPNTFLSYSSYAFKTPAAHRPRMLLAGQPGQGQTTHLAPAIIHYMEQLPVHVLDLPSLFAVSTKTPEESCAQTFREARRTAPSIIYMPHIEKLWSVLTDTLRATFMMMLSDLDPTASILLLATSECDYSLLQDELIMVFDINFYQVINVTFPTESERRGFFKEILLNQTVQPPSQKKQADMLLRKSTRVNSKCTNVNSNANMNNNAIARRFLEVLPKAAPPEPRKLTDKELKAVYQQEETTLRELRLFLRDVINKLGRDRKFQIFAKAVDIEDAPDYYEIIKKPMDLGSMMSKIDLHGYQTAMEFLDDINLICLNALEYNPDKTQTGRAIRHRACALKDTAEAIIKSELDPDFEKQCVELVESRKRRGIDPLKSAPEFYHTKPLQSASSSHVCFSSRPSETSGRTSRRLRGLDIEESPPLDLVEKQWAVEKSLRRTSPQKSERGDNSASDSEAMIKQIENPSKKSMPHLCRKEGSGDNSHSSVKKTKKDVWGRSSYRSRRRKRNSHYMSPVTISDARFSDTDDYDVPDIMSGNKLVQSSQSSGKSHDNVESSTEGRRGSISNGSQLNDNCELSCKDSQTSSKSRIRHTSGKSPERLQLSKSPERHSLPKSADIKNTVNELGPPILKPMNLPSDKNPSVSQKSSEKLFDLTVNIEDISNKSLLGKISPKAAVVKSMETDSGISSSVDSNGDSVDSIENAKQLAKQKLIEAQEESTSQQNVQESKDEEKVQSPTFRVTRARLHTQDHEHALEILEEQTMPVVVDHGRLTKFLDSTVSLTKDFKIEKLEKLYSLYSSCIYSHCQDYDKTLMIEELEKILQKQLCEEV